MDELLKQVSVQIACYLGLVLGVLFIINRWSVGFLAKWAKVKTSRGQKVLVNARTNIQDYFAIGWLDQGDLMFKGKDGKVRRLTISGNPFYRRAGIVQVDVDDVKNAIALKDFSTVQGHDAEKTEDLFIRCLYKPSMLDDKTKIILGLLIVTLLGLAALAYFGYSWHQADMEAIARITQVGAQAGSNIAATTGGA